MTTLDKEELLARRLPLNGTYNVREIGGYQTRDGGTVGWGLLLRGDALHHVDNDGRGALARFGLRTSVDLRENAEREEMPDQLDPDVRLVHVPLFSYGIGPAEFAANRRTFDSLDDVYRHVVVDRGAALAAAMGELARAGALPAIVHCTGGKDRTGIVVALLLETLGVPDEVIAEDFAATSMFLNEEFRQTQIARAVASGQDGARFATMLGCEASLILDVLAAIRSSYGSVESYLVAHGLRPEELEQLRRALLEPTAAGSPAESAVPSSDQGATNA
jgi:protein-tyrosine phosphatase